MILVARRRKYIDSSALSQAKCLLACLPHHCCENQWRWCIWRCWKTKAVYKCKVLFSSTLIKLKNLIYLIFLGFLTKRSEKAMAPHSSTLAWKIPWAEEPGRLQSTGSLRVGHDWATSLSLFTFMHWRRKWQPTPAFLPGESQQQGSLVGCRLWGRRVRHNWSDLAVAAAATKR